MAREPRCRADFHYDSDDFMMLLQAALVAGWALGHTCVVIWVLNTTHGAGIQTRWVDFATLGCLAVVLAGSLALLAWAIATPVGVWPWYAWAYAAACWVVGLIALPCCTLANRARKAATGARRQSAVGLPIADAPESRNGELLGKLLALPANQSLRPVAESWDLALPGLPEALDGFTILQLSDLHMAPCMGRAFFASAIEYCQGEAHDLVLVTGDIVEHESAIDWIGPILGPLRGRLGQFAILGNHDLRYGPAHIRAALADAGYVDVEGRWVAVTDDVSGRTLALGGTSAPWGERLAPPSLEADARIVLSHTPDQFYRVARWDCVDLMLCGHNHGGQVCVPWLGPIVMPSVYSRRFDQGFFQRGSTWMHVSRGLGAKIPLRWNCPPEITRIRLRAGAARPDRSGGARRGRLVGFAK